MTSHDHPPAPVPDLAAVDIAMHVDTGWELAGSLCEKCKTRAFPARSVCHRCGADNPAAALLGGLGTLYSFTTVHISAVRPVPYTLGYIDMPGDLRVLAQLMGSGWKINDPVQLRVDDLTSGTILTSTDLGTGWAFTPVAQS